MYGVWFSCLGGWTHTALLNRVESKAFRLINSPPLTDCLVFLSHRRNVASLSLFYRHFHADCSSQLANCMPPSLPRPRFTKLSTSHPFSVHLSNARINQYFNSFTPFTGKIWNSLRLSVFPPAYDLNSFISNEGWQDTSHAKLDLHPLLLFFLLSVLHGLAISGTFFILTIYYYYIKKLMKFAELYGLL